MKWISFKIDLNERKYSKRFWKKFKEYRFKVLQTEELYANTKQAENYIRNINLLRLL